MKKKILLIKGLFIIELISIFLIWHSVTNRKIEKITKENNVSKEQFAMYIKEDDEYIPYTENNKIPPEGYKLNINDSKCVDNNGDNLEVEGLLTIDENNQIVVTSNQTVYCTLYFEDSVEPIECTSGISSLTQGSKYTKGQFTYSYMQQWNGSINNWDNISLSDNFFKEEGWGVKVTNLNSKDPIKPEGLCSSIDGKPVISTVFMFYDSQASSIDISNWNTSHVTYMAYMFKNTKASRINITGLNTRNAIQINGMFDSTNAAEIIGYENLNTQNVTNMSDIFEYSKISNIDISRWNTKKVIWMGSMFNGSQATEIIGLDKLDTSQVTNIQGMFMGTKMKTIDISKWDTSNVTSMNGLFYGGELTEIIGLNELNTSNVTNMREMFSYSKISTINISKWDTSKVTDMYGMFRISESSDIVLGTKDTSSLTNVSSMFSNTTNLKEIDLSGFDISKISTKNMTNMFTRTSATVGYAKDQNNLNIFNGMSSSDKPTTLKFKLKD